MENSKEIITSNNLYEIYTRNPTDITEGVYAGSKAGEITGWEIKWVLCPDDETIEEYPFFDCVISKNDNSTGQAKTADLFFVK